MFLNDFYYKGSSLNGINKKLQCAYLNASFMLKLYEIFNFHSTDEIS